MRLIWETEEITVTRGVSRQVLCVEAAESCPEWEGVLFEHMVSLSALEHVAYVSLCSPGDPSPPLSRVSPPPFKQRGLVDVRSRIRKTFLNGDAGEEPAPCNVPKSRVSHKVYMLGFFYFFFSS